MKKLLLAVFVFSLVLAGAEKAQAQSEKRNVIKINYLSPAVSTLSMFYERAVTDMVSAQLGLLYTGISIGETSFTGFAITPEARIYLSDKGAPEGFFLAPFVRYTNFTLETPSVDQNGNATQGSANFTGIGGGVLLGGQWIFADIISLDVWGGLTYGNGSVDVETGQESDFETGTFDGFSFRFGSTIGVAF